MLLIDQIAHLVYFCKLHSFVWKNYSKFSVQGERRQARLSPCVLGPLLWIKARTQYKPTVFLFSPLLTFRFSSGLSNSCLQICHITTTIQASAFSMGTTSLEPKHMILYHLWLFEGLLKWSESQSLRLCERTHCRSLEQSSVAHLASFLVPPRLNCWS